MAVLSLGIGLSTALVVAVNAVMLRRLPMTDQARLVVAWRGDRSRAEAHLPLPISEARRFAEWSRTLRSVSFADRYFSQPLLMRDGEHAMLLNGDIVTGGFFATLGTTPALGRFFTPEDDRTGAEDVAVIGYEVWQREFAGSGDVLGKRLQLHGSESRFTIVGVAPKGLDFPSHTQLWMPLVPATTASAVDTSVANVDIIGRLAPDVLPAQVGEELARFLRESGRSEPEITAESRTIPDVVFGDLEAPFATFAVAVGLLLLVTCGNVAELLLMRGIQTRHTIAMRLALGARVHRIVRRQLLEGLLLASGGGVGGLAVASTTLRVLRSLAPAALPRGADLHLDGVAYLAVVVIALVATLLFALGPAISAARTDGALLVRTGSTSLVGGRREVRVREGLVTAQVAAAVVVLCAAAVLGRSFLKLEEAPLGMAKDGVAIVELAFDFNRLGTPDASRDFFDRLHARLGGIPGVAASSALLLAPGAEVGWDVPFIATDRGAAEQASVPALNVEVVTPEYFDLFRVPLRRGRYLSTADREGAPRAVVLSEGAAQMLWPGADPIGRQIARTKGDRTPWTVVGIVADTRYRDYRTPRPTVYSTQHQSIVDAVPTMLAVRSSAGDPLALMPQVQAAVRETDGGVRIAKSVTLEEHLDGPLAQPRFNATLLAIFACSALAVVAAGLYAVLAFNVRLRARELAIRSALGATPGALGAQVVATTARMTAAGGAIGLGILLLAMPWLRALTFGVRPTDPVSVIGSVAVLAAVALVASLLPAHLARTTAPARVLQEV